MKIVNSIKRFWYDMIKAYQEYIEWYYAPEQLELRMYDEMTKMGK